MWKNVHFILMKQAIMEKNSYLEIFKILFLLK